MQLYTVVSECDENTIKAKGGIYIQKKEYSKKELAKYLEIAKHYYVKIHTETYETDFNDDYHDSWTNYIACNHLNMVIKDDELYGFVAYGLGRNEEDCVVLTFKNDTLRLYDGSDYSNIDREFYLLKYVFEEEVLDIPTKYKLVREATYYKIKNNEETDAETYISSYYFTCFDVVLEEGKPVALKTDKVVVNLNNPETFKQEFVEENVLGVQKYRIYYKYELVDIYQE